MDDEIVLNWFKFADTDLAIADHLLSMRPQPLEPICFHCQQSAEKRLKGYLIHNGINEPPKTHDLLLLLDMCVNIDDSFNSLLDKCNFLTEFGVLPRYPNEIEIDESIMNRAIRCARDVKSFEPLRKIYGELRKAKEQN
jgi:HEPN domain-containing protein